MTPNTQPGLDPAVQQQIKQLLDQLKPIFTPDPASYWPLAPGWWAAGSFAAAALVALIWWLLMRHAQSAYRREALALLAPLQQCPLEQLPQQANTLLKRTALAAYANQRHYINGAFGREWVNWLNARCPYPVFTGSAARDLAEGGYMPAGTGDREALLHALRLWIQKHHPAWKQRHV